MIKDMNHASFTVSNLDKSISFYKEILGLKHLDTSTRDSKFSESVTGIKDASLKIAYFEANNCRVELIEYLAPIGKKIDTKTCNIGSAHICFNVENFNKYVDSLRLNNVVFSGNVSTIPAGPNMGKQVLYFEDLDNNSLEIISTEIID